MSAAPRHPAPLDGPLLVVHGHRDGNAVGGQPGISAECVRRVERARRIARDRRVGAVLLCGCGAPGHPSEAHQMAALWHMPGVPVYLDERSTDSAENAWEALRWAGILEATELIVVSSWWHVRLLAFYRHRRFDSIAVRHARTWSFRRVRRHLLHELRYQPRVRRLAPPA
jgi:hypothetical protein